MQILYIYIPVNGQPQLRTPFCVKRVSTHESFHCSYKFIVCSRLLTEASPLALAKSIYQWCTLQFFKAKLNKLIERVVLSDIYEQLWTVTRRRLTLFWSCPWKVSTIRDSLLIVYCLKISLLYEWPNKLIAILFSLHFERLRQRKMAN